MKWKEIYGIGVAAVSGHSSTVCLFVALQWEHKVVVEFGCVCRFFLPHGKAGLPGGHVVCRYGV